jgi:hypothetical protein
MGDESWICGYDPETKQRLETVSDVQRESQAVLDIIKDNDFHGAFEVWKNDGINVYRHISQETILKEMATKND